MEPRKQRGMIIAATKNVRRDGIRWIVPSQFSGAQYSVFLAHGDAVCTCPDYETRREKCKHIYAAIFVMRREEHPDKQWQLPRPRRRIIRSNGRHITPPRQAKRINFNSYYLIFAEAFLNLLNLKSRKLDGLLYRYLMLFSASLSRFIPQLADGVS